jgi:ppGpp synthetase/RelA/SpoT-type nucleotidyltranferase
MTDVLQDARARFEREWGRYEAASVEVAEEIAAVAHAAGISTQTSGRAKDVASFVKKTLTKEYADPWRQTTDKAGARATVAGLADVHSLVEALKTAWGERIIRIEDKSLELDPQMLAYSGVHVQVVAPPRQDDPETVECEVQVRTAAQDVWSVLSHKFVYKPALNPPKQTKRALMRLVALIEIFDEEVERAVTAVLSDPEYPQARLLHHAEHLYYGVATSPHDAELSLEVLGTLVHAVPMADWDAYSERLTAFAASHHDDLVTFFAKFSPEGELATEARYALGTQPEALVLIELAATAPMLLLDVLSSQGTDWLRFASPILESWGTPLPHID